MEPAESIWKAVLGIIQLTVTKSNYKTWFADTKGLSVTAKTFVVGVKDDFTATCLKKNHLPLVERTLFKQLGRKVTVEFTVDWDPSRPATKEEKNISALYHLRPELSFENFVVGPSNQLAHAAALSIADGNADNQFNPLFICASPGLGKTHLLQAIGQRSVTHNLRPLYVSCSSLISECIKSFSNGTTDMVKEKYASADVLMVDDIHDLAGKEATQDIFFSIFNTAREAGHQIVVTSDRTPTDMDRVADRLKSRFEWGLITDIQAPEFETRVAIIKSRIRGKKFELSNEIIFAIAEAPCTNIRELEGRLNKVIAYATLLNEPITMDIVRKALRGVVHAPSFDNELDIEKLISEIASSFGVTPEKIIGSDRDQKTALARQVTMYVLKQRGLSLVAAGQAVGNRNASTVSHAVNKIEQLLVTDSELFDIVSKVCPGLSK